MAESVNTETPIMISDLKDEDFFTKFDLKKLKVLGEGMSGKVYVVQRRNGTGRLIAVKEFSFLDGHREWNSRLFTNEAGFMQVRN